MEGIPNRNEKVGLNPLSAEIASNHESLERDRALSIDMQLSQEERESLDRVKIERVLSQFDFYGTESEDLKKKVQEYLREMGENSLEDLSRIADVVSRLSEGMRQGFGEESTWTMIRVSLPNSEYEIPRWHPDGKYFRSEKKRYKLVATLKGSQTRFGEVINDDAFARLDQERIKNYQDNEDDRAKFKEEDMRIRKELEKVIQEKDIGGDGEAVVYLVGEKDAVLHSEPNITEPRIFVSVLPGSNEQIAQWAGRTSN